MKAKKIFILAGEVSGDQYAGLLIRALKRMDSNVEIYAMGGKESYEAGATIILDPTALAVVGLWEVLKHIREFKYMFRTIKHHILRIEPDVIVFIDYPGFNLRLAKELRTLLPETRFVYYISPQLWAWGRGRVKLMKRLMDKILVIFPFEVEFYKEHGIEAKFVGHPLGELLSKQEVKVNFRQKYGIPEDKDIILLLPGSRIQEVKSHLPVFLEAASRLKSNFAFCINKVDIIPEYIYKEFLSSLDFPVPLIPRCDHASALSSARLVWVASGTATLETAFYNKPMIVVYKVAPVTYFLLRPFVDVKYISMVNILADELLVPELIQGELTASQLLKETNKLLEPDRYRRVSHKLGQISKHIFSSKASLTAAMEILYSAE